MEKALASWEMGFTVEARDSSRLGVRIREHVDFFYIRDDGLGLCLHERLRFIQVISYTLTLLLQRQNEWEGAPKMRNPAP